jgi:hypothetical protein
LSQNLLYDRRLTSSSQCRLSIWAITSRECLSNSDTGNISFLSTGEVLDPSGYVQGMEPETWLLRRSQLEELGGPPGAPHTAAERRPGHSP